MSEFADMKLRTVSIDHVDALMQEAGSGACAGSERVVADTPVVCTSFRPSSRIRTTEPGSGSLGHAFDVLGDPMRRRILELLADGEQTSGAVTEVIRARRSVPRSARRCASSIMVYVLPTPGAAPR
jgi:hypothetical protein